MVWAVTGDSDHRRSALAALVEACQVAYHLARLTGRAELAMTAADRVACPRSGVQGVGDCTDG